MQERDCFHQRTCQLPVHKHVRIGHQKGCQRKISRNFGLWHDSALYNGGLPENHSTNMGL